MTDDITTERLRLRHFTPEDAPDIVRLINTPTVSKWLTRVPYPYGEADAHAFIDRMSGGETWCYAVIAEREFVGVVSILGELGYWYGQPFWGKGYATEAGRALVDRYFDTTEDDLTSGYLDGNAASQGVLTKLGFAPDGRQISVPLSTGQETVNHRVRLTRDAWRAGR